MVVAKKRSSNVRAETLNSAPVRVEIPETPPLVYPQDVPADWRVCAALSAVVLLVSIFFLFFQLGFYPFWGDEAETAIYARGIARTGDSLALIDHNLYAYRNGSLLKNLHGRYVPPLSLYMAAPFVGRNGTGTFWPRFPFAVCGLATVAFMLYWMKKTQFSTAAWIATSIAICCNISLYLYCRQCRYYGLAILLSVIVAYLYVEWNGRRSGVIWLAVVSILLMYTHYLAYAGLYFAIACDYFLFSGKKKPLSVSNWAIVLVSQLIAGLLILKFYNPMGANTVPPMPERYWIVDKLILVYWHFKDINYCEFGVGILMLATIPLYWMTRNKWLLRGAVALISYVLCVVILSPQPPKFTYGADVRYIIGIIPLCIVLSAYALATLARHWISIVLVTAPFFFGWNIANHPIPPEESTRIRSPFTGEDWQSRPYEFAKELFADRETSIGMAADWINKHVSKGQTVWAFPGDDAEAPLMYHAPTPTYCWHLSAPQNGVFSSHQEQFRQLPPAHFFGGCNPDYMIAFGPLGRQDIEKSIAEMKKARNLDYQLIDRLLVFFDMRTRPEFTLRSFSKTKDYNENYETIYIYKKM